MTIPKVMKKRVKKVSLINNMGSFFKHAGNRICNLRKNILLISDYISNFNKKHNLIIIIY